MDTRIDRLATRYPGKRILITGAASGLGLELGRRFADAGWRVGMLDRDAQRLEHAGGELPTDGRRVHTMAADVSDPDEVKAAIDRFAGDAGGLDIVVNNAGVGLGGAFQDIPVEDWHWILGINLMGCVHGCRAALPHLRTGGGLIVNVASAAAFISSPQMSGYNASKAAVVSLSETLYGELLDTPVDVCVVMPAFFKTNLLERLRAPDSERETARLLMEHSGLDKAQVVDLMLDGMAKRDFHILAPGKLKLLWRFKRLFPVAFMKRFKALREKRLAELKGAS